MLFHRTGIQVFIQGMTEFRQNTEKKPLDESEFLVSDLFVVGCQIFNDWADKFIINLRVNQIKSKWGRIESSASMCLCSFLHSG